jgi:hypothetical protein
MASLDKWKSWMTGYEMGQSTNQRTKDNLLCLERPNSTPKHLPAEVRTVLEQRLLRITHQIRDWDENKLFS